MNQETLFKRSCVLFQLSCGYNLVHCINVVHFSYFTLMIQIIFTRYFLVAFLIPLSVF